MWKSVMTIKVIKIVTKPAMAWKYHRPQNASVRSFLVLKTRDQQMVRIPI